MDKLAAANRINEFLKAVVTHGGLHLKYRIVVDPPALSDWEKPEIFVDFSGPDSTLLLDRGGELLARPRIAGLRNSASALRRAREDFFRLQEPALACDCRNCAWRPALPPKKFARPEHPFTSLPCRRASGASSTSPSATKPTCAPRAMAKACDRCVVLYPADYKPAESRPARRTLP